MSEENESEARFFFMFRAMQERIFEDIRESQHN